MKKYLKILTASMIVFIMVVLSIGSTYADSDKKKHSNNGKSIQAILKNEGISFKDVKSDFWACKSISNLVKLGIINGYPDNTFKPNESVTRSQFANMLTKALDLTSTSTTQTFTDVPPSSWDFKAVEASKSYLTGYKTSTGAIYFYGTQNAVREDMAVALVKALNLPIQSDNGQLQQIFTDYDQISANLKDYVFTAYKNGIMIGSKGNFGPQKMLTRAEAATLLERALEKTEKITIDGNGDLKIVIGGSDQTLNSDATLSYLFINGTAAAGFSPNIFTYNVILTAGTTTVPVVTAFVHDTGKATAVVTQAGSAGLPGSAVIVVTAQDGVTKKTYTVNFTVAAPVLHTDATLSSISINGNAIAGFAPNTLTYNAILPAGTTVVPSVAAAVNDTGKATAVVTQAAGLPGSAVIVVTAQDGVTKKTYTVNFTVAAPVLNTDATLSSISINGNAIAGFAPNTLTYNAILPAGTTAVPSVAAAVNDTGKATAVVTQAAGLPGSAVIVVTAQDGTTKKTYTINFTVAAPVLNTDATLSSISINGAAAAGFAPNALAYNVILPAGTTVIPVITAAVNDTGKATVVITQAAGLPGTATLVVTAQDGTTQKTYTLNFVVAQ